MIQINYDVDDQSNVCHAYDDYPVVDDDMTKNIKLSSPSSLLSENVDDDDDDEDSSTVSSANMRNDPITVNSTTTLSKDTSIATLEDQSPKVMSKQQLRQQEMNGVLRVGNLNQVTISNKNTNKNTRAASISVVDHENMMEPIPGPPLLFHSKSNNYDMRSVPGPPPLRETKSAAVTFAKPSKHTRDKAETDQDDEDSVKGNNYMKTPRNRNRTKTLSLPRMVSPNTLLNTPSTVRKAIKLIPNSPFINFRDAEGTSTVVDNSSSNTSSTNMIKQSSTLPSRHGRLKVVGVSAKIMQAGVDHNVESGNNNNNTSNIGASIMLRGKTGGNMLRNVARAAIANNTFKSLNNKAVPDISNEFIKDGGSIMPPPLEMHHDGNKVLTEAEEYSQDLESSQRFSYFTHPQSNEGDNDSNYLQPNSSDGNDVLLLDQGQQSLEQRVKQQSSSTRIRRHKTIIETSSHHSDQSSKSSQRSENILTREGSFSSTPSYTSESIKPKQSVQQYRLQQTFKKVSFSVRMVRLFGFGSIDRMNEYNVGSATGADDSCLCFGRCSPNQLIIRYLHWTFRQSFTTFIIVSSLGFWALTVAFAVAIMVVLDWNPQCLGGTAYSHSHRYADAYQLSWTTFATVGYGIIYPSLSPFVDDIQQCTGVTVLVTLEAFVGMLYASFCSAILFIKVSRIQSVAQVAFSDPIVVRYGTGLLQPSDDDSHGSSTEGLDGGEIYKLPCPILEFRIANRMHNVIDGEIINCSINIVASIDAKQTSHIAKSFKNKVTRQSDETDNRETVHERLPQTTPALNLFVRKLQKSVEMKRDEDMIGDDSLTDMNETQAANDDIYYQQQTPVSSSMVHHINSTLTGLPNSFFSRDSNCGNSEMSSSDDTEISKRGIKRVFTKLVVESSDHPFFNRVWTIRHRLNEDSPLLKQATRELIKKNHGYWPVELNHYDGVKNSFHFDSFLVSFSGTSNADCSSCYAQHIYDFDDVNVGYTFRNMICHERKHHARSPRSKENADGEIDDEENCWVRFDLNLLDSIIEQAGGGGEPIYDPLRARYLYELQLMKTNRSIPRLMPKRKYPGSNHSVVSESSKRSFSTHHLSRGKFVSQRSSANRVNQMVTL